MSAQRDLVGRPLVPFFDAQDNVNDALTADATMGFERMDVDARVWNKELGYFEYPSEQPLQSHAASGSAPIAIVQTKRTTTTHPLTDGSSSGSYGRTTLLTPAMMLSSSCPDTSTPSQSMHPSQPPTESSTNTRSSSAKCASKQGKSRSNTPVRRRNNNKSGHDSSSGGEQPRNANDGKANGATQHGQTGKKGKNRNSNKQDQINGNKSKEELSAQGKWAWSAFQSSPDPKLLPLPPFLTNPASNGGIGPPPPPLPPQPYETTNGERLDFLGSEQNNSQQPPQPTIPPESHPSQPPPMSIEVSMTQDLRRMLNIGGG
ncbi:Palmitoyl-protein thioesterase 1, partial [Globisporangium splendens]